MDEDVLTKNLIKQHTFRTWGKQKNWDPLVIKEGKGAYFYDSKGNKYLDFSSQFINVNLGYGNENVIKAIEKQLETLQYINPSLGVSIRAEASRALLEVMPKNITKFFFSTSGTEANEAAIKIIRLIKRPSFKILSRYRSYHGSTEGSISLTGDYRRWFVEPNIMPGVVRFPEPYCFRCPLKLKYPDCGIACANYVDYIIKQEKHVAGIIVEPITGTNGVIVPPKEYMPLLRKIAMENDVLFIADEVMTGWGRVGEWFAVNLWGVEPDILTTAKGASASYVPIGITGVSKEIGDFFEDNVFAHGHTFEAHPVSLAAIPAVISEYKRVNLLPHVREMGKYLGKRLNELKERHISIGDVRGVGLFWAVELVKDGKNTPFADYNDKYEGKPILLDLLAKKALESGVFVYNGPSWFIIAPPLVVEKEDIDKGVEALDKVIREADNQYRN
ncbi:aspartate aminotransferase family protein [Sulfolobus acidocaldarius]|uniref:Class-III aminotransferase n=4 Tax=Sulfolobus acidocaldarius TaxID=2285 RepID=Q4J715_SULAC|nr:aspartate aminotransferase family protein [Sulfolobus acidocaldarius]AAY81430.1 class-III aminotransferase [Sulfolobus acidocaldarius DSM 639]AGE72030.1 class-III aminotransferase [Sulfolobus acidocaldarius N8]AGE74347.1 class-III aminotransferase [Sulfolobus acidocaldarius Ron12/I]ALU29781.1 aminotransferase [Sulfolobus acidocaldarius]ALU32519.1 aminotransferase [Sulfolobus acidocaldarius]